MNDKNRVQRSEIIEFFLCPNSYPHSPNELKHIQTHASDVFVASPYVYKIKKPVDFGFLDYSTLEKRKYFCEKELELNKRLCCSAYIGIEEISLKDGRLKLGSGDETIEYSVVMNLLPEKYFLHNLLKEGMVSQADITRIAETLSGYYKSQIPSEIISNYGQPENIKSIIDDNISTSNQFLDETITINSYNTLKIYNDTIFKNKSGIFIKRMQDGWIRDCHGDLRLEHINLSNSDICIYDCIEFNEKFRCIDIASDVAFLSMDLDYNGYYQFSNFFIGEISGMVRDASINNVLDFYKCYRAIVRGKVESLKSIEPEVPEEERARARKNAESFYKLALKYALFGSKPVTIVAFGLIGTGKSTIAEALSKELSVDVITSDIVRKRISGIPKYERKFEGYDTGLYSSDVTEKTYNEMFNSAEINIKNGKSVIMDASFSKKKWRDRLVERITKLDSKVYFIKTEAPKNVIEQRLIAREKEQKTISDARLEILDRFIADYEEPAEINSEILITIDTSKPASDNIGYVFKELLRRKDNLF